ncbi:MAG TPA: outer membrane beta-barrel protein [Gemmatimonadaceae bacterium]
MRARSFVPMLRSIVILLALPTLSATAHAQSRARPLESGTVFEATPYVGYMVFGDFVKGPLGTSIYSAPAPVLGAQLGMHLAPNILFIGNIATTSSDIKAGIPFIGGLSVAHSTMVLYDAGLQLNIPVTSSMSGVSFSPFIQAGVGAIHYDISQSIISTKASNFAGNVGLGADVTLTKDFGIRLLAKDYIGKFDVKDATSLDYSGETANNFALSAGVRVSF